MARVLPVFINLVITLECPKSLEETACNVTFEVIIADDGSAAETRDALFLVDGIRLFSNKNNLGFLRNCNKALAFVIGAYTLFLDNDVQVLDYWLDALVNVLETEPAAGAVGPKIIYPSGHLQEAGVSLDLNGTARLIGITNEPTLPAFSYKRIVDYCSGYNPEIKCRENDF